MEIAAESVRAIQVIHGAAILEEMGVFAVADRVVEQLLTGLLPLGPGPAAETAPRRIANLQTCGCGSSPR